MAYLNWDTKTITDFSPENVAGMYSRGYIFTRVGKGIMNKTRSFRVDLSKFELSSENRRILRKAEHIALSTESIPFAGYHWRIGKMAKDFYEKFGDNVFTANKVKEIFTEGDKTNFNRVFVFTDTKSGTIVGYVIAYDGGSFVHYSYPFYIEDPAEPSRGLGMMTKAIEWTKASGKHYMYLGSLSRPSDTYKLQFKGGEWFDGEKWQTDVSPLKEILK
ncbi:MAG TPA: GNAT family N-acetyltransferase [Candidatus Paceibacterota bacterium]|nr:GNAT family N-acetyltransferase [Candidatus Paceibacterota bacterium]